MNKKVLVVDDSPVDQANIKSALSDAGCIVITASNGTEAIAKAKAEKPAIIFLDIIMPEMDGFETCRTLSQSQPSSVTSYESIACYSLLVRSWHTHHTKLARL